MNFVHTCAYNLKKPPSCLVPVQGQKVYKLLLYLSNMKSLTISSLALLLACSSASPQIREPTLEEISEPSQEVPTDTIMKIVGVEKEYKGWVEAAQRGEIAFTYDPTARKKVHLINFLFESPKNGIGSGWFAKDGKRLTFERATKVQSGEELTFIGGYGLDSVLEEQGFVVGQQYIVSVPMVYAIAEPKIVIEDIKKMDPDTFCRACDYKSRLGLDFFYRK